MNGIAFLAVKFLVTAAIIVGVSELVKITGRLGALVAALPTVTILVLIWMYVEGQPHDRIANHAWYTLWYVIPTLPMFVAFPWLYDRMPFWPALSLSCLLTAACFGVFILVLKRFGIDLA